MKEYPRNESFTDRKVGAGVRLMVRGGGDRMTWKYDDDKCQCGLEETEKHVLFECTLYGEERGRWRVAVRDLNDGIEEYEIIKGYRVRSKKNRKRTHEISESNVEQ